MRTAELPEPVPGQPELRRFRTYFSASLVVFRIVGALGLVAGAIFLPVASALGGLLLAYATWVRLQRTVVDRRQGTFAVRLWRGPRAAETEHPLEQLTLRRSVTTSKGTVTITYDLVSGTHALASGMLAKDAAQLPNELMDFLGRPRLDVPE